jgi:hypothetical protein
VKKVVIFGIFFGLRVWNNSRYISNCIFKIIFFNIKKIIFFMGFSSQPSRLDLSFFILHSYLVFIFLFKIIFFMFLNNFNILVSKIFFKKIKNYILIYF